MTAACRSCSAPIIWGRHHSSGNAMPMDVEPHPLGAFLLREVDGKGTVVYHAAMERMEDGEERFVSHFATCPQAKEWRA